MALLRQAGERGMPIWSFDQWLTFWEARQEWRCESAAWDGSVLQLELAGEHVADELSLALPEVWRGLCLGDVVVDGEVVAGTRARRHGRATRLVPVGGGTRATVSARYAGGGKAG